MSREGRLLPVQPLLGWAGSARALALRLAASEGKVSESTVRDRIASGLSPGEADLWSALLGCHFSYFWDNWLSEEEPGEWACWDWPSPTRRINGAAMQVWGGVLTDESARWADFRPMGVGCCWQRSTWQLGDGATATTESTADGIGAAQPPADLESDGVSHYTRRLAPVGVGLVEVEYVELHTHVVVDVAAVWLSGLELAPDVAGWLMAATADPEHPDYRRAGAIVCYGREKWAGS